MNKIELYLISEGPSGPVKVGVSKDCGNRAKELQTGNARPLSLVAAWRMDRAEAFRTERELREELEDRALVGEWFSLGDEFMLAYLPDFFLANGYEAQKIA